MSIDRFGNLVTNIGLAHLQTLVDTCGDQGLIIEIAGRRIYGLAESYASIPSGGVLAIVGSRDCLEIAVSMGNAAEILNVEAGAPVHVGPACGQGNQV